MKIPKFQKRWNLEFKNQTNLENKKYSKTIFWNLRKLVKRTRSAKLGEASGSG
jgi:hypothetical protein